MSVYSELQSSIKGATFSCSTYKGASKKHPEMCEFQTQTLYVGSLEDTRDDYFHDKITGEKICIPMQKPVREYYWTTLPEDLTYQEKWAYWVVQLLRTYGKQTSPETKEAAKIFYKFCLVIKQDQSFSTPTTLDEVVDAYEKHSHIK